MARVPKAAVILAGCGHVDGAEVREAVFTLLARPRPARAWRSSASRRTRPSSRSSTI